jgi:SAM-dependent methyltransferase
MSSLGLLYQKFYDFVCGSHPNQYPWHFQWLAVNYLHTDLKHFLNNLGGCVLDVGCGQKPYKKWFGSIETYTGLDVTVGADVDIVINPESIYWPLENDKFDTVLCTQVLEHVKNIEIIHELIRITKNGGTLVVSAPFIYNEHGSPNDYRRYTAHGIKDIFLSEGWNIIEIKKQGGIGSTIGILFLNWFFLYLNSNKATRILKGLLLPVLIFLSLTVNSLASLLDKIDNTESFYHNVILVAKKPCE